jgi:hypothetical protein
MSVTMPFSTKVTVRERFHFPLVASAPVQLDSRAPVD